MSPSPVYVTMPVGPQSDVTMAAGGVTTHGGVMTPRPVTSGKR